MITDQIPDTSQVPGQKSSAAHGALWITVGTVSIGLFNYGYSLLLTHLLNVAEYSVFSAGQSLILWATNIATVSVPWVLAQALARAKSERERNSAIRFAKLMSGGTGVVAGIVVGGIATALSGPGIAVVVAASTFIIFLGTTTSGWLQGDERMRSLSLLYIAENVLKNVAGILLVTVAGLKSIGALAGFGIGGLAMLARWPRTPRGGKQSWRELVNKEQLAPRHRHRWGPGAGLAVRRSRCGTRRAASRKPCPGGKLSGQHHTDQNPTLYRGGGRDSVLSVAVTSVVEWCDYRAGRPAVCRYWPAGNGYPRDHPGTSRDEGVPE